MPKKIMFVCMGNICRSPLAEAVFYNKISSNKLKDKYISDSSGVTGYHTGEKADKRMRETALRHGIVINHRAKKLTLKHIDEFDLVLAMDYSNMQEIKDMAGSSFNHDKIRMFREFDPVKNDGMDVPDPYYGGASGFENVYRIVDRTCSRLLEILENAKNE